MNRLDETVPGAESGTPDALDILGGIVDRFRLQTLIPTLQACRSLTDGAAPLDVAVFGQFKSGKSSLVNALLSQEIVPVGVLPVTALITRISAGANAAATVTYLNGRQESIDLARIGDFVDEARNPKNRRHVALVDVQTPSMNALRGLRLVDTPGLGSVFTHNTRSTRDWLPNVAVALLAMSVERPLSDEDRRLLVELRSHAPRIAVVLTKIDLLTEQELEDVQAFVRRGLAQEGFGDETPVVPFSCRRETDRWLVEFKSRLLSPLMRDVSGQREAALSHKLEAALAACHDYLTMALRSAEQTEQHRARLRDAVLGESIQEALIRDELDLVARRLTGQTRSIFKENLLAHQDPLVTRLESELRGELRGWRGNLSVQTQRFEQWLTERLGALLSQPSNAAAPLARQQANQARERFQRIIQACQDRLRRNIITELGIEWSGITWQADVPAVRPPPIAVSRVFDILFDMLWWVLPMRILGPLFHRHFLRLIPWEVEKNLTRIAGDWAERVNEVIEELRREAVAFVTAELTTLSALLAQPATDVAEIRAARLALDRISTRSAR